MRVPGWIDRDHREPAAFPATVALPDGRSVPVTITNVSRDGCEVSCNETLPIGAIVELRVGGEPIPADVRWELDGRAGLRLRRS